MSEVAPLISDLAIILIIAGIVTVIFKWLKQPVILGYIVAGIMAGPSVSLVPTVSILPISKYGRTSVSFFCCSRWDWTFRSRN